MTSFLKTLTARIGGMFSRRSEDAEFSDELREHLDMLTEENVRRGMPLAEARREAKIRLGGATQLRETHRELTGIPFLETLAQDIRYALRMLGKSPGFTAVAILTLALGIGANTAIFSLIDGVMLRSIPVKDPQSLVVFEWLTHNSPRFHNYGGSNDCGDEPDGTGCSFSVPLFNAMRTQRSVFSGLTAFAGGPPLDISGNGAATTAQPKFVSGDFFSTLGVKVTLGRALGRLDDSPNAPLAMVLSYAYWQRAFGGDRAAVGRTIRVNNVPVQIVGVADPRFTNLSPGVNQDFFLPLSAVAKIKLRWMGEQSVLDDPYSWWVTIAGRLKPGVAVGQAQAAASTIFRNEMLHGDQPQLTASDAPAISLVPAPQKLAGNRSQFSFVLYVLMVAVGAILLIACANVAGLTLARSATRQKEMAVRLALGAGRRRIVRQLLTESVLLSVLGGTFGVLLALWGVDAISRLLARDPSQPFPFVIAPDWRILTFTIGITFFTGIFFGLAPALRGARVDLTPALKENASSVRGSVAHTNRSFRLGDALVVVQVALSIVVLVGAGLLMRTLRNLHNINPGFDTSNVLLFGINPTQIGYKDAQSAQLFRDLRERFAALPGVVSASYSSYAMLSDSLLVTQIHLDGAPAKKNVVTDILSVGPGFFSTMRIPMLAGRGFNSADFASAAETDAGESTAWEAIEKADAAAANGAAKSAVPAAAQPSSRSLAPMPVIINETFARKYFANKNPVGRHFGNSQGDEVPPAALQPGYVVLGMCGDTKFNALRRKIQPAMYYPFTGGETRFELRTAANPEALAATVRNIVSHVDNNLPLTGVMTQTEQIDVLLSQERMIAQLSSFFGLLALLLACIGLYGLLAYEVARRTREIGIRVALGAQRGDVLKLMVGQGIALTIVGAMAGVGAAIGVTRFMASMLYGVDATDPVTFAVVAIVLLGVALLACWIPARRAMKVDPMVALRYE